MQLLKLPLTKILLFFVAGILFAFFVKIPSAYLFGGIFTLLIAIVFATKISKKRKTENFIGIAICSIFFILGCFNHFVHTQSNQKSNYTHLKNSKKEEVFLLIITEKLKTTAKNQRYLVEVCKIGDKHCSGKIILNIRKTFQKTNISIGNQVFVLGELYKNEPSKNPESFNYANYLQNKHIYAQLFVTPQNVKTTKKYSKNATYFATLLRNKIETSLQKSSLPKKELQVFMALLLGQRQDLTDSINKNYQLAGVVHILSVSGLHVGLLLQALNYLLSFLPNNKKTALYKLFLVLLLLGFYAVLTGLSPSVLRSVVMFGFVAIGQFLKRNTSIYYSLLVSMFVLLIFNPYFLLDVGFQLSYLALFSILWIQPIMDAWWRPKNKVVRYFWTLFTVSVAAQLGTAPLCLYYFHQFPGLFLLSNLIVIPITTALMFLGFVVLLFACFGITFTILLQALEWLLQFMNFIIAEIASLDTFVLNDIRLTEILLFSAYSLLFSFIFWIKKPTYTKLLAVFGSILIFQILLIKNKIELQNTNDFIVFHQAKTSLISTKKGQTCVFYSKETEGKTKRVKENYLQFAGIKKHKNSKLPLLYYFNEHKILLLDSLGMYTKTMKPDVVIITQSSKINLDRFLQICQPKVVVADGSNSKNLVSFWKKTCQNKKILFHATAEKGFYRIRK